MKIVSSRQFEKAVSKLPKKVRQALAVRLVIFVKDPFNVLLNNHALHGSLRSYRSINITGDYRLIYEDYARDTVRLIDIDTHSNLYGN
ncbi:MAG: type II toxin-antitoxin system mRNA interferase toxin, RelE/StbE family [bacterium]|nr:type II toxin-antitoxin system mRNA interferase toxin, RelE/StbE family [bacterium]